LIPILFCAKSFAMLSSLPELNVLLVLPLIFWHPLRSSLPGYVYPCSYNLVKIAPRGLGDSLLAWEKWWFTTTRNHWLYGLLNPPETHRHFSISQPTTTFTAIPEHGSIIANEVASVCKALCPDSVTDAIIVLCHSTSGSLRRCPGCVVFPDCAPCAYRH
jgi:hypothetical protein